MRGLFPTCLLVAGVAGAVYTVYEQCTDPAEFVIGFAFSVLIAVIGWTELRADLGEQGEGGGF